MKRILFIFLILFGGFVALSERVTAHSHDGGLSHHHHHNHDGSHEHDNGDDGHGTDHNSSSDYCHSRALELIIPQLGRIANQTHLLRSLVAVFSSSHTGPVRTFNSPPISADQIPPFLKLRLASLSSAQNAPPVL